MLLPIFGQIALLTSKLCCSPFICWLCFTDMTASCWGLFVKHNAHTCEPCHLGSLMKYLASHYIDTERHSLFYFLSFLEPCPQLSLTDPCLHVVSLTSCCSSQFQNVYLKSKTSSLHQIQTQKCLGTFKCISASWRRFRAKSAESTDCSNEKKCLE